MWLVASCPDDGPFGCCCPPTVTRKRKLLEKQKAGKARMRQLGAVSVPVDLFPELMKAGR